MCISGAPPFFWHHDAWFGCKDHTCRRAVYPSLILLHSHRAHTLSDQINDLSFTLHHTFDQQYPARVQVPTIAHDNTCDSNHNFAGLKP